MVLALGVRLQAEADAVFGHAADKGENLLYIVGRTVDIFCKALKDSNLLKKFATGIGLSAEWLRHFDVPVGPVLNTVAKEMMTAKGILGAAEMYVKWDGVVKPWRERTVVAWDVDASDVNPVNGALQNHVQAAPASIWEQVAKKASQVSDWAFGAYDFATYALNTGLVSVAKESVPTIKYGLGVVQVVAGFSMSGFGIWEEGVKLWTGNIVRSDASIKGNQVVPGDGYVWKATFEDQVHSWIKIAMGVAYFVLAVYGLAALVGVLLPAAATVKLACLSVATVTALANHFWEKIAIDSLNRAGQRPIV